MGVCWCGNTDLVSFSRSYLKCNVCETIVAASMPGPEISRVEDDERDFYGRPYWFSHQEKDLGHPDIVARSRTDLAERCLHWLRTLLKHKIPPAKVLEMGSAHGGFVAMLRWAGYDASGLEISPWVVDFARRVFDVPMLLGPIEDQAIEPDSLDVIALMDVLEHLPDPAATMRQCLNLLRKTGILMIQTPRYPEHETYSDMAARDDSFLKMLREKDHIYLFSLQSIKKFFDRLGVKHLVFEPAIFSQYDMFLVAGGASLTVQTPERAEKSLSATPRGRMIQALLDLDERIDSLKEKLSEVEVDREARLKIIEDLGRHLQESEADRAARLAQINELTRLLKESEADRAARLEQIDELTKLTGELNERLNVIQK